MWSTLSFWPVMKTWEHFHTKPGQPLHNYTSSSQGHLKKPSRLAGMIQGAVKDLLFKIYRRMDYVSTQIDA